MKSKMCSVNNLRDHIWCDVQLMLDEDFAPQENSRYVGYRYKIVGKNPVTERVPCK